MKTLLACATLLAACGLPCAAAPAAPGTPGGDAPLPADVKALLNRVVLCDHLAGEYDAPGSQRTIEVSESVEREGCAFIEQDLKNMKRRYARHPAALRALAEAESKREP
ncbi:MAG: hypothetical protein U1F53_11040 [Burkholderiaceae bacterium]